MKSITKVLLSIICVSLLALIGWSIYEALTPVDFNKKELRDHLAQTYSFSSSPIYIDEQEEGKWLLQSSNNSKIIYTKKVKLLSVNQDTLYVNQLPILFKTQVSDGLVIHLLVDSDTVMLNKQSNTKINIPSSTEKFKNNVLLPYIDDNGRLDIEKAQSAIELFSRTSMKDYFGQNDTLSILNQLSTILIQTIKQNQIQNTQSILRGETFEHLAISNINISSTDDLILLPYEQAATSKNIQQAKQPTIIKWLIFALGALVALILLIIVWKRKPKEITTPEVSEEAPQWVDLTQLKTMYFKFNTQPSVQNIQSLLDCFVWTNPNTSNSISTYTEQLEIVETYLRNIETLQGNSMTHLHYNALFTQLAERIQATASQNVQIDFTEILEQSAENYYFNPIAEKIAAEDYNFGDINEFITSELSSIEDISTIVPSFNLKKLNKKGVTFLENLHKVLDNAKDGKDLNLYLKQFNKKYRGFFSEIQKMDYPPTEENKTQFFRYLFGMTFHIYDLAMSRNQDPHASKYQKTNSILLGKELRVQDLNSTSYKTFTKDPYETGRKYLSIFHIAKELGIKELEDVLIGGVYIPKSMFD